MIFAEKIVVIGDFSWEITIYRGIPENRDFIVKSVAISRTWVVISTSDDYASNLKILVGIAKIALKISDVWVSILPSAYSRLNLHAAHRVVISTAIVRISWSFYVSHSIAKSD